MTIKDFISAFRPSTVIEGVKPDQALGVFQERQRALRGTRVYKIGGGWGSSINWSGESNTRVHGWKTPRPHAGDRLHADMQSGRTGVYIFTKVDPCRDPEDMFFADVEFSHYLEEA